MNTTTTSTQVAHPNLGYTLDHLTVGGGIATAAIAIAVCVIVCVALRVLSI